MATIDLGKIKIVWRGTYAGGTAYTVDDAVEHTDSGITSSFICTTASTGNAPSTGGSVHSSWAYLAKGSAAFATLTTQGDILYRGASADARLAKGTAAQHLLLNAGATAPEWSRVAAASTDFEKITSASFTAAATMNITDAAWGSGYDTHEIHLHIYSGGSSTSGDMRFKFSDDDGSSFETSLHSSSLVHTNSAGSGNVGAYNIDAGDYIYYCLDGVRPSWGFARIHCSGLTNAQEKQFLIDYSRANHDGATRLIQARAAGMVNNTSSSNNLLQFSNSGGHNIIGRYVVYGIKG